MSEIKLYGSRKKLFFYICLTLPFVVAGIALIIKGKALWIGIGSSMFFGACLAVFVYQIFNRKPQVILNENGIWSIGLQEGQVLPWEHIESAYLMDIYFQKFICIKTNQKVPFKGKGLTKLNKYDKMIGAQDYNIALSMLKINSKRFETLLNLLIISTPDDRKEVIKTWKTIKN